MAGTSTRSLPMTADLVGGGSFGASIDLPALLLERRQATGGQGADQACSGDRRGAKAKLTNAPERQSDHRSPEGEDLEHFIGRWSRLRTRSIDASPAQHRARSAKHRCRSGQGNSAWSRRSGCPPFVQPDSRAARMASDSSSGEASPRTKVHVSVASFPTSTSWLCVVLSAPGY